MDIKEIKELYKQQYCQNIDINYIKPNNIIIDKDIIDNKPIMNQLSSNSLFTKPWTKLHITHKKIKIKEYINNLNDISENQKVIILENIIKSLINKNVKKNDIIYNEQNGNITSIDVNLLNN